MADRAGDVAVGVADEIEGSEQTGGIDGSFEPLNGDAAAPPAPFSVANPADGSTILRDTSISFTLTGGNLFLWADLGGGVIEIVHDGVAFTAPYLGGSSVVGTGPWGFTLVRAGLWTAGTLGFHAATDVVEENPLLLWVEADGVNEIVHGVLMRAGLGSVGMAVIRLTASASLAYVVRPYSMGDDRWLVAVGDGFDFLADVGTTRVPELAHDWLSLGAATVRANEVGGVVRRHPVT